MRQGEESVDARCYDRRHTRVSGGDERSGMRGWSITLVSRPSVLLYFTWRISSPKHSEYPMHDGHWEYEAPEEELPNVQPYPEAIIKRIAEGLRDGHGVT
jgi:hypothetical protein